MVYLVAFLVPALLWMMSIMLAGIFPFGNNIIFTSDMAYQYAGYFEFVQKILTEGVSPFFSFYKGMGEETLGMMAYYMMSPFNLILALFSQKNITEAVLVINLLKIATCGLTFSIFLKHKFKNNNSFAVVGFSTCYALMAYNIAYQFNIMWLDGVIWLPIIILGIDRIIKHGKSKLFYISLTIAIISNWYIGFMLCLFSGLYTIYSLIMNEDVEVNKHTLKKVGLFGVLAAGTALVVIFPSAITCLNETARSEFIESKTVSYVLLDLLSKFVIGGFDFWQITDSAYAGYLNLPNLFAGTTVLLLFIAYFFNKSFDKKERMRDGIFGIALLMMTLFIPLNRVWHVFTYNVWFPYRYSFCLTFFMIYIAYKSFLAIKEIELKRILQIFFVMVGVYFVVEKLNYTYIISETIYCTIMMLFAGFIGIKLIKKDEKIAFLLLSIVMCSEMFINTAVYMQKIGYSNRNVFYQERSKLVNVLDEIKSGDPGYYRIENNIMTDYNTAMGQEYLAITTSSTMGKENERGFLESFGYTRIHNNSLKYVPNTKFGDNILGVKYYIEDEVKKNDDALSLGFVVEESIKDIEGFITKWGEHSNSFEKQNEFVRKTVGIEDNLYKEIKVYDIVMENLEKSEDKEKKNTYVKTYPYSKALYSFSFDALDENEVYLKMNGNVIEKAKLYINGEELCEYMTEDNFGIIKLGSFEKGEKVKVDLEIVSKSEFIIPDIWVYCEDSNVYEEVMLELKRNQLEIRNMNGSVLEGEIDTDKVGMLLFSIPYDKYLTVFVDGELVESECVLDSLLAIKLNEGKHIIKVSYEPNYMVIISIVSLGFFILAMICILFEYRKKKSNFEE